MYAIIKTGGKQYKVQAGDVLQIDKIDQDLGAEFTLSEVLMIGGDKSHVGTPLVKNAVVTAVVTKQARTRKIIVFKKKRRQGYRKFGTHKQHFTEIFISSITSPDGAKSKTDNKPVVKDMAALRTERIETKMSDRVARVRSRDGDVDPVAEKVEKKKAAPKKAASAKKPIAKAASKRSAKKATKKTTKKTK
ncbi:MAG: 50S ribosomal protein L21 [Bdellovibrionaceae bacterium]|nr:50S ribosomal protein L21 [Bdellovibrio sp.]